MESPDSRFLGARQSKGPSDEETERFYRGISKVTIGTTISTALQVCIATHFFYYCVLHFGEEIEYIWSRPWTRGKLMYLITRYAGAIFLMIMVIGLLPVGWNDAGRELDGNEATQLLEKGQCLGGYLYVVAGTVVFFLAEVILAMRVYALYGRKKRTIALSAILMTISAAATQMVGIVYFIKPADNCIGMSCALGLSIPYQVTVSCTMASLQITVIGWVATSLVELVFLCLVLWKTRQMKRIGGDYSLVEDEERPYAHDIIGLMARDSKKYFLCIFLICFIGTCLNIILIVDDVKLHSSSIAIVLPALLGNTFLTFAIAVLTILAPELLINIRIEYYGPVGSLADEQRLSWDVAAPREGGDAGSRRAGDSTGSQYSIIEDREARGNINE